jgi:hypothetical protein
MRIVLPSNPEVRLLGRMRCLSIAESRMRYHGARLSITDEAIREAGGMRVPAGSLRSQSYPGEGPMRCCHEQAPAEPEVDHCVTQVWKRNPCNLASTLSTTLYYCIDMSL